MDSLHIDDKKSLSLLRDTTLSFKFDSMRGDIRQSDEYNDSLCKTLKITTTLTKNKVI